MVVVILSIVSVSGLEMAVQFLGARVYAENKIQLTRLDQSLVQFYRIYGRLPCPSARGLAITNSNFGLEDCTQVLSGNASLLAGGLPFRTLNLPLSMAIDGYGNRLNYVVTAAFADATSFAAANAAIQVRTGRLEEPCSGSTCQVLANPSASPPTGAAYFLFSNGPDKRGALSRRGVAQQPCANTNDTRIDAQNCVAITGTGSASPAPPATVFYDSRYNSGSQAVNYFDDIVIWRAKEQL